MKPEKSNIKNIDDWNALDFVKYFVRRYQALYNKRIFPVYAKDCTIVKRIIRKFHRAEKTNKEVYDFFVWAFDEKSAPGELTIGVLARLAEEYFELHNYKEKEIDLTEAYGKEEEHDKAMSEWLEKEREKWEKDPYRREK